MNPNLYVIKGSANHGKTTTCWKLLQKLKDNGNIECYNYWKLSYSDMVFYDHQRQMYVKPNPKQKTSNLSTIELSKGLPVDFIIVARLNNPSHCKVAIISEGDSSNYVKQHIYEMLSNDVHHIVCCERNMDKKGSTLKMLHSEFEKPFVYEKKISHAKCIAEEDKIADEIYNLLIKL